ELESIIIESVDPEGPYGAKEAGEGPLHPSVPAIANAIHDALGIRCDALPFSPPAVLALLNAGDARAAWELAHKTQSATGTPAGAPRTRVVKTTPPAGAPRPPAVKTEPGAPRPQVVKS